MNKFRKATALAVGTTLALELGAVPAAAAEEGPIIQGIESPADPSSKYPDLNGEGPNWENVPGSRNQPETEPSIELTPPEPDLEHPRFDRPDTPIDFEILDRFNKEDPEPPREAPEPDLEHPRIERPQEEAPRVDAPKDEAPKAEMQTKKEREISFSIREAGSQKEIGDVMLALYEVQLDIAGVPILVDGIEKLKEWTSGSMSTKHLLEVGKTYALAEVETPEGFEKHPDVIFTVVDDDSLNIWDGQQWTPTTEDQIVFEYRAALSMPESEAPTTTESAPTTTPQATPKVPSNERSSSSSSEHKFAPLFGLLGVGLFAALAMFLHNMLPR